MNEQIKLLDISNFEFQLREALEELCWKTKVLQEAQKELSQTRYELNKQQVLLEDERRKFMETKVQLQSALEITKVLEEENIKNHSEKMRTELNYEAVLRERYSLLEQTRNAKIENMRLKNEIQDLKEIIIKNKDKYKTSEQSFLKLRKEVMQTNFDLYSITKLTKEHDYLRKSVETVIQFNKRLQTVGLCMHAVYQKQENHIKRLQQGLALATSINVFSEEQNESGHSLHQELQLDPQTIINELKSENKKMENFEKQFISFLSELQNERWNV